MGKKSKKVKFKAEVRPRPVEKRNNKKEAVTGTSPKGGGKTTLIGVGVAVLIVGLVAFIMFGGGGAFTVVSAEAGEVKIPVAEVNDGKAHFYTFKGRRDVNFFVLRSSDGVIRAAFDACDVCYREKKGYHQEGDLMVCNNCGQVFPSVKINVLKGGCNPAPLDRAVQGEYLVMKATDIEAGGFYF
jgi:uncharacterized membrane protein